MKDSAISNKSKLSTLDLWQWSMCDLISLVSCLTVCFRSSHSWECKPRVLLKPTSLDVSTLLIFSMTLDSLSTQQNFLWDRLVGVFASYTAAISRANILTIISHCGGSLITHDYLCISFPSMFSLHSAVLCVVYCHCPWIPMHRLHSCSSRIRQADYYSCICVRPHIHVTLTWAARLTRILVNEVNHMWCLVSLWHRRTPGVLVHVSVR